MANNDTSQYTLRYNEITGNLEFGSGNNWFPTSIGGGEVTSLNTLTGDITLAAGTGIALTPSGNTIIIDSTGGAPAGSDGQLQFNNNGVFGASSDISYDGSSLTTPVINVNGIASISALDPGVLDIGMMATPAGINLSLQAGYGSFGAGATFNASADGNILLQSGNAPLWTLTGEGLMNLPNLTTAQRDGTTPVEGSVIYNSTTHMLNDYNGTTWGPVGAPSVVDSAATVGGAAAEEVAVAGLLTTSTIWAVTQVTAGGAALPLTGWTNVINGNLNVTYSADMGPGAVVRVVFIP